MVTCSENCSSYMSWKFLLINLTVNSEVRKLRPSYTRLRIHLNVALAAEQRSGLPGVVKPLRGSRERT